MKKWPNPGRLIIIILELLRSSKLLREDQFSIIRAGGLYLLHGLSTWTRHILNFLLHIVQACTSRTLKLDPTSAFTARRPAFPFGSPESL